MKKTIITTLILLNAALAFGQSSPEPLVGYWIGTDMWGKPISGWQFYIEGGSLCGRLISSVGVSPEMLAAKCKEAYPGYPIPGKVNEMRILGGTWIFGLQQEDIGRWVNGQVIDPSKGSVYACSVTYHPEDGKKYTAETLEMRGKMGIFEGSVYWRKAVSMVEASAFH
jgi:uncharacterized protein (DUF2147 family)